MSRGLLNIESLRNLNSIGQPEQHRQPHHGLYRNPFLNQQHILPSPLYSNFFLNPQYAEHIHLQLQQQQQQQQQLQLQAQQRLNNIIASSHTQQPRLQNNHLNSPQLQQHISNTSHHQQANQQQLLSQQQQQLQQQQQQHLHQKQPQQRHKSPLLDIITCKLCKFFIIDAVTLTCSHSFCRSCAIKYLKQNPECPECPKDHDNKMKQKSKGLLGRLKSDTALQNIIYKLVPGLYEQEMQRRKDFYAKKPGSRYDSEMFGDIPPSKTIKSDETIIVSMKNFRENPTIELCCRCRVDVTIRVLKKLIATNYDIQSPIRFYYDSPKGPKDLLMVLYNFETLKEIAATYNWTPENKVMNLIFEEVTEEKDSDANSSSPTNSDPVP